MYISVYVYVCCGIPSMLLLASMLRFEKLASGGSRVDRLRAAAMAGNGEFADDCSRMARSVHQLRIYIHIYIYIHVYVYMHICIYVYMYIYI